MCSAQCGEGFRKRKVECKIFLEFSKTVARLPDHKCPGPKPSETEICFAGLCDKPTKPVVVKEEEGEEENDDFVSSQATEPTFEDGGKDEQQSEHTRRDIQQDHIGGSRRSSASLVARPLKTNSNDRGRKSSYKWKEDGFTECTESCLGGTYAV